MLKLAVIVCVVLFVSFNEADTIQPQRITTKKHAPSWLFVQKNIQRKTLKPMNNIIRMLMEIMESNKITIDEKMETILNQTYAVGSTILKHVRVFSNSEFLAKDDDISKCIKMSSDMYDTARANISNMNDCVKLNLKMIKIEQIDFIDSLSRNISAKLTKMRNKAKHCSDNIVNEKSAEIAKSCANNIIDDALWSSLNVIDKVNSTITDIDKLSKLNEIRANCSITSGFEALIQKVNEFKNCTRELTMGEDRPNRFNRNILA